MKMDCDLPIGKALIAVETKGSCRGCFLKRKEGKCPSCIGVLPCSEVHRKDGKNVIFKMVDYNGGKK